MWAKDECASTAQHDLSVSSRENSCRADNRLFPSQAHCPDGRRRMGLLHVAGPKGFKPVWIWRIGEVLVRFVRWKDSLGVYFGVLIEGVTGTGMA